MVKVLIDICFFAEFIGLLSHIAKQQQNHRVAKISPMLQNEMDSLTLVQKIGDALWNSKNNKLVEKKMRAMAVLQHAMQNSERSTTRLVTPLKKALPLMLNFASPLRTWLPEFLCAFPHIRRRKNVSLGLHWCGTYLGGNLKLLEDNYTKQTLTICHFYDWKLQKIQSNMNQLPEIAT